MSNQKLWGGRFSAATDKAVEKFTASVHFDQRLALYDIQGSIAHAQMLGDCDIISKQEAEQISDGLAQIRNDIESGNFSWRDELEDVHMNIEASLTALIGDTGKKLHTGRSRNDQIATDMRLYVRDVVDALIDRIKDLQGVLIDLAEQHSGTIMPGYTHLQAAQPVTFGHHMLAWEQMLDRDRQRLIDSRVRINISPLGAAALAGTTYPINREQTAKTLDFDRPSENSQDSVSDRDFVLEFCANTAILGTHISRMAEEMVIWSSDNFKFVDLGDAFCTGSSIMPQKKNPDVAELLRGKSARLLGNQTQLLVLMKGQPLTYNRDNQEDKEALFDSADTSLACVDILVRMLAQITVNKDQMYQAASDGFSTATDLADYLVKKQIPFRDAHEIVGKVVGYCVDNNIELSKLSIEKMQEFSPLIEDDVFACLTLEGSVNSRDHIGGTAPKQVKQAVERAKNRL